MTRREELILLTEAALCGPVAKMAGANFAFYSKAPCMTGTEAAGIAVAALEVIDDAEIPNDPT